MNQSSSAFSTLHLLDQRSEILWLKEGMFAWEVGEPQPGDGLGELNPKAVVSGEGEDIVAPLVENGPEGLAGVAYRIRRDHKVAPEPVSSLDHILPHSR